MDRVRKTLARGEEMADKPLPRFVRLVEGGVKRLLAGLVPIGLPGGRAEQSDPVPIAPPVPASLLKPEIEALPVEQPLVQSGQYRRPHPQATPIPCGLQRN